MKTHELKTWPVFYNAISRGLKTFELRKNDRDFQAGDKLILKEWSPKTEKYTGLFMTKDVKYILHGSGKLGLKKGYCIMSLD